MPNTEQYHENIEYYRQYRIDNREYYRQYYKDNREIIAFKHKQTETCPICNCSLRYNNMRRHKTTLKHLRNSNKKLINDPHFRIQ